MGAMSQPSRSSWPLVSSSASPTSWQWVSPPSASSSRGRRGSWTGMNVDLRLDWELIRSSPMDGLSTSYGLTKGSLHCWTVHHVLISPSQPQSPFWVLGFFWGVRGLFGDSFRCLGLWGLGLDKYCFKQKVQSISRSWISGVTSLEVMLAHVVAQFVVMVVQVTFVLVFMLLVFQVSDCSMCIDCSIQYA